MSKYRLMRQNNEYSELSMQATFGYIAEELLL